MRRFTLSYNLQADPLSLLHLHFPPSRQQCVCRLRLVILCVPCWPLSHGVANKAQTTNGQGESETESETESEGKKQKVHPHSQVEGTGKTKTKTKTKEEEKKMNGRKTHSSKDGFQPRKYQSFRMKDVPEEGVFAAMGDGSTFKLLSWKANGVDSAMTANVTLAQGFRRRLGLFCKRRVLRLRGVLKIGNFVYRKHSYSYIPAGQVLGEWASRQEIRQTIWWAKWRMAMSRLFGCRTARAASHGCSC